MAAAWCRAQNVARRANDYHKLWYRAPLVRFRSTLGSAPCGLCQGRWPSSRTMGTHAQSQSCAVCTCAVSAVDEATCVCVGRVSLAQCVVPAINNYIFRLWSVGAGAHGPIQPTRHSTTVVHHFNNIQNNSVMNRTRHSTRMYVPCFTLIARNNPMEPCSMPHTTQLSRSVSSFQASTISDHMCRARPYVSFGHRMLATDVETDCLLGCRHCRLGSFSSWCASSCRPACQPRVLFFDRLLLL